MRSRFALAVAAFVAPASTCRCAGEPGALLLDDVCVLKVVDGSFQRKDPQDYFHDVPYSSWDGVNQSDLEPWVVTDAAGLKFAQDADYGGFIIVSRGTVVLVDAGLGVVDPPYDLGQDMLQQLERLGCDSPDVMVHSHLHRDHTGWDVKPVVKAIAANVRRLAAAPTWSKYLISSTDFEYWSGAEEHRQDTHFDTVLQPAVDAGLVTVFKGNFSLAPNVTAFPCPGHSPGHTCVDVANGQLLLVGDAMHHPSQVQLPWLTMWHDWNASVAIPTRTRLTQLAASTGALIGATHWPSPFYGHVVECHDCGGETGLVWKPLTAEMNTALV
jgi:glyoxylase-like metal-dependent hydrolase (beta-lactamase superfamily II)